MIYATTMIMIDQIITVLLGIYITIATDFTVEIRCGRCHILEFRAQRCTFKQLQIARQKREYIVDEAYILAGGPNARPFVVIQFGVLVDARRAAVFHFHRQGRDGAEGARLCATISICGGFNGFRGEFCVRCLPKFS